jgi:hypothetical protein
MFCPNCGKEIKEEGIRYCPYCGYDLKKNAPSPQQEVVDQEDGFKPRPRFGEEPAAPSPNTGIALGVLSILFALPTGGTVGLILGIIGLTHAKTALARTLNIIGLVFSGSIFFSLLLSAIGL